MLGTTRADGRPRLVPVTFAVASDRTRSGLIVYSPLDEKPKSVGDVRRLGRVRDVLARPSVSVLVDRWSEDWAQLAWLRLDGTARLVEPAPADADEHRSAVGLLRNRYNQYASQRLEELPLLAVRVEKATSWGLEG